MFSPLRRNQWYERIEFSSCYCLISDRLNTTLHTVYVHPSKSIQIHPNPSMSTLCIRTRAKQNSESIKFFQFVEISQLVWPAVDSMVYWCSWKINRLDGVVMYCGSWSTWWNVGYLKRTTVCMAVPFRFLYLVITAFGVSVWSVVADTRLAVADTLYCQLAVTYSNLRWEYQRIITIY